MQAGARSPGGVIRDGRRAVLRPGGCRDGQRAVKAARGADGTVVRVTAGGQGLAPGLRLDAGGAVAGGAADKDPRPGHLGEGAAVDAVHGVACAETRPGAHGEVHHVGPQVPGVLQRPENNGVIRTSAGAVGEYLHAEDLGRRGRAPEGDMSGPVLHISGGQGGDVGAVVVGGGHAVVPAVVVIGEGNALGNIAALGATLPGKLRHVLPAEGGGLHQGCVGKGLVVRVQAAVQNRDHRAVPGIALLPQAVRVHELQSLLRREGILSRGRGGTYVALGQAYACHARQGLQGGQPPGVRLHSGSGEEGLVAAENRYARRLLQEPGGFLRAGGVFVEDHGTQRPGGFRRRGRDGHGRKQQYGQQGKNGDPLCLIFHVWRPPVVDKSIIYPCRLTGQGGNFPICFFAVPER